MTTKWKTTLAQVIWLEILTSPVQGSWTLIPREESASRDDGQEVREVQGWKVLEEAKVYNILEMWRNGETYIVFVWYFDYASTDCNSTKSF